MYREVLFSEYFNPSLLVVPVPNTIIKSGLQNHERPMKFENSKP